MGEYKSWLWAWFWALRKPRRLILTFLVLLAGWLLNRLQDWVNGLAVQTLQARVAAHSQLTIGILKFIAAHFIWVPWAFVPITVVAILVWGVFDASQAVRERIPALQTLIDEDLHKRVVSWLVQYLSNKKLAIQAAFLFGSIVYTHYDTSDVDVLILFKPMRDKSLSKLVREIKYNGAQRFEQTFRHRLHVQTYAASEASRCDMFLAKQGKYESLQLKN